MITITGINLFDVGAEKVVLNGYWVNADEKDIRTPKMESWNDEAHRKVTNAIQTLEEALEGLIPKE